MPDRPLERPAVSSVSPGPFQTNCYLVRAADAPGADAWLVDAGFDVAEVIDLVRRSGATLRRILLTHAHVDHMAGVDEVRKAFPGVPVAIHRAEEQWLGDPERNLSAMMGVPISAADPDELLNDGDALTLGAHTFRVLHTPGHSPGGVGFYHAESGTLIAGDTLFAGSIGRTDFPGSDPAILERSIRERLYTLPGGTRVHPGHGPATTIDRERRGNPFVRA